MESLWPVMTSDDDAELMMTAIAHNIIEGVKEQMKKGITGATLAGSVARGPGEITMFQFACERGNLEAAKLLYCDEIDIEVRSHGDLTPLMSACAALVPDTDINMNQIPHTPKYIEKGEQMVQLLVELGADVNAIREADTMTVLHWAAKGCSEHIVCHLINNGAKVDWPENDNQPAFVLAARANNVGALKAFVENDVNINRPCTLQWAEGRTALGVAILEHRQGYKKDAAISYLKSVGAKEWPEA